MPRCRYCLHQDFLFRSARERLHLRNRGETNGEWREREGYYGSGSEERREERLREERRARERCDRILNPIERDRCFHGLSNEER